MAATEADLLAALLVALDVQTTALDRMQALLKDQHQMLDEWKQALRARWQARERILSPHGEIDACSP